MGAENVRSKPATRLASATRPALRISPSGRDAGEDRAEVVGGDLAVRARAAGLPPQPVAGGLARAGVVLLTPVGDGVEVVVLRAGHHLADGEHPGVRPVAGQLSSGSDLGSLADQGQEGGLGDEATAAEADDGELAAGDQLVGEGPGDPEQLARLGDGVDEALCGGSMML